MKVASNDPLEFWDLSDEEIMIGMDIMHDSTYQREKEGDPLMAFAYDSRLQKMAMLWLSCDKDRVKMRLRYHDELRIIERDEWTMRAR